MKGKAEVQEKREQGSALQRAQKTKRPDQSRGALSYKNKYAKPAIHLLSPKL